jgi:hypothetical protein
MIMPSAFEELLTQYNVSADTLLELTNQVKTNAAAAAVNLRVSANVANLLARRILIPRYGYVQFKNPQITSPPIHQIFSELGYARPTPISKLLKDADSFANSVSLTCETALSLATEFPTHAKKSFINRRKRSRLAEPRTWLVSGLQKRSRRFQRSGRIPVARPNAKENFHSAGQSEVYGASRTR